MPWAKVVYSITSYVPEANKAWFITDDTLEHSFEYTELCKIVQMLVPKKLEELTKVHPLVSRLIVCKTAITCLKCHSVNKG